VVPSPTQSGISLKLGDMWAQASDVDYCYNFVQNNGTTTDQYINGILFWKAVELIIVLYSKKVSIIASL